MGPEILSSIVKEKGFCGIMVIGVFSIDYVKQ